MKFKKLVVLMLIVSMVFMLAACSSGGEQKSDSKPEENKTEKNEAKGGQKIVLTSGSVGGSWYPLAGAMAKIFQEEIEGLEVEVVPGGGAINVKAVESNKAQLGLGNSITNSDGWNGVPPFDKKHRNQAAIAVMYPQFWQPIALDPIKTIPDLKGKVLGPAPKGHTGEVLTRRVLEAYGMSYDDMKEVKHLGYGDTTAGMRDGHIDAFTPGTAVPSPSIVELSTARKINYIPLEDDIIKKITDKYPGLVKAVIPAGTYKGQDKDWPTIGWSTIFFCRPELPEDLVYKLTKAVFERREDLEAVVKGIKSMSAEKWMEAGIPLHPGAAKYYRELGIEIPDEAIYSK